MEHCDFHMNTFESLLCIVMINTRSSRHIAKKNAKSGEKKKEDERESPTFYTFFYEQMHILKKEFPKMFSPTVRLCDLAVMYTQSCNLHYAHNLCYFVFMRKLFTQPKSWNHFASTCFIIIIGRSNFISFTQKVTNGQLMAWHDTKKTFLEYGIE